MLIPLTIIFYSSLYFFFFFNNTATTEIYTLSLHDALPIYIIIFFFYSSFQLPIIFAACGAIHFIYTTGISTRSEEHTSELQSRRDLVCRLLLEKKKTYLQPDLNCFFYHLTIMDILHLIVVW